MKNLPGFMKNIYYFCALKLLNKERCQHKVLNLGRLVFAKITIFLG